MTSAQPEPTSALRDALTYLEDGLPIFPVCSPAMGRHRHGPNECTGPGKRPMIPWLEYQERLPTRDEAREWWGRWPLANIGMACGQLSQIVVLDADGGDARKEAMRRGGVDRTPSVWTGKPGGCHFWLAHPGEPVRNFARKLPGLDFRGDGGYVLLPPSVHASGARYRWVEGTQWLSLSPVPPWLRALLDGRSPAGDEDRTPLDVEAILAGVPEGGRDDQLYRFACKLRAEHVPQAYAELAIAQAARRCRPPFAEADAVEKVRRAYREFSPTPRIRIGRAEVPEDGAAPVFEQTSLGDLLLGEDEPVDWYIVDRADDGVEERGLLAAGDTAIMGAETGAGKTWAMIHVAQELLCGGLIFGRFRVVRPLRVMVIDEESSRRLLKDRWRRMLRGKGIDPEAFHREFEGAFTMYVGQGFNFDDSKKLAALYEAAEAFRPDVIIGDTLTRLHRRNENDNSAIRDLFEEIIKPFRRRLNCVLLFTHHTRKRSKDAPSDGGSMLRGAGDFKGQTDNYWFIRGESGNPKGIFEHNKSRWCEEIPSFTLSRETTENGGLRLIAYDEVSGTASEQQEDVILRYLIDNSECERSDIMAFGKKRGMAERTTARVLARLLEADRADRRKVGRSTYYWAVREDE